MPDMWLDDHVGDEVHARPEFRSTLRESLADELGRRRPPWRALAWSAAALVAVAVVTTAVLAARGGAAHIEPGGETLSGDRLAAAFVDREWYLVSMDGSPSRGGAFIVFHSDGTISGTTGCQPLVSNRIQPTDGWHLDGRRLRVVGDVPPTFIDCPSDIVLPFLAESSVSLSNDGTTMTMTDVRTYILSTDPLTSRVQDRQWYLAVDDGGDPGRGPWFELRSDGTFSGHDGCNSYFSYTRDSPPDRAWSFDGDQLHLAGTVGSTRMACVDRGVNPLIEGAIFQFRTSVDVLMVISGRNSWKFVTTQPLQP